jgi:hypothetical protein
MRAKFWAGLMTIAVVAPLGAHADIQVTNVWDLWDSGRAEAPSDLSRVAIVPSLPVAAELQSNSAAPVAHRESAIRAVDTYQGRAFRSLAPVASVSSTVGASHIALTSVAAAPTSAAPPAMAAPEMSSGFAAAGLTLLFGGVAILRGRRSRI